MTTRLCGQEAIGVVPLWELNKSEWSYRSDTDKGYEKAFMEPGER